jgi:hypothetical protein
MNIMTNNDETMNTTEPNAPGACFGRVGRLTAGTALVAILVLTTFVGRAEAADYDSTGVARTASGATAMMDVRCGPNGAELSLNFGFTLPTYYAYRIVNANTNTWATNTTSWYPVTARNMYPGYVITAPGNWRVVVQIIHGTGGQWYSDTEYTNIINATWGYPNSYCHTGR